MKALFWDEEPASRPVIRATYFLQRGHGWLPYTEKDSELLEVCVCGGRVCRCRYKCVPVWPTSLVRVLTMCNWCRLWIPKRCRCDTRQNAVQRVHVAAAWCATAANRGLLLCACCARTRVAAVHACQKHWSTTAVGMWWYWYGLCCGGLLVPGGWPCQAYRGVDCPPSFRLSTV